MIRHGSLYFIRIGWAMSNSPKRKRRHYGEDTVGVNLLSFFSTSDDKSASNISVDDRGPSSSALPATNIKRSRDYSKYKQVCLLCSSDKNKQERAILSRGGAYQIERHRNALHPDLAITEVTKKVVQADHSSVPESIRRMLRSALAESKLPRQTTLTCTAGSIRTSTQPADVDVPNQDSCTRSEFVTIEKQAFEDKVLQMIEKLNRKVDSLKEGSSTSRAIDLPLPKFDEGMREPYQKMNEWRQVSNIIELVRAIKCLELYPLSNEDRADFADGFRSHPKVRNVLQFI